jgi:crossover junction endodeoxyribonuclease RusA
VTLPHSHQPSPYAGAAGGVLYRLTLPYREPPAALRGNYRGHWSGRSKASREVRETVSTLGRAAGLHRLTGVTHIAACLRWAPGDRRRRDAGNLWPFSKALIDGLTPDRTVRRRVKGKIHITRHVGCGLVPDDVPKYVNEMTPIIVPPPERGMWLYIWINP